MIGNFGDFHSNFISPFLVRRLDAWLLGYVNFYATELNQEVLHMVDGNSGRLVPNLPKIITHSSIAHVVRKHVAHNIW